MKQQVPIIISVGGSLIVPNSIDTLFLQNFTALIRDYVNKGFRFVIITGGGRTARNYQEAAKSVANLSKDDADWIGIHSTRLNGHMFRTLFADIAHPVMVTNPHEDILWNESILIAAGWRPGCSTDYDAVLLAKNMSVSRMINLSNIDYVYTADPRKDPTAEKIESIGWADFRKLIPDEWDPGLSSPFDPIASREAEKLGMEVAILNGLNLDCLRDYLDERPFVGTRIY